MSKAKSPQLKKCIVRNWSAGRSRHPKRSEDAVNRSRSTLKGKIAEQIAPLLPEFLYNPADARFIGSPLDYIIFDGLTDVSDDKKASIRIIFMDVKKGSASLSRTQRVIKEAIEEKAVSWETLRIK
jgi:predicted Holliday junction resolvase-like endonuclease